MPVEIPLGSVAGSIPAFCPWPTLGSPRDLLRRFGHPSLLRRLFIYRRPPALPVTSRFSVVLRFGAPASPEPSHETVLRVPLLPFYRATILTGDGASDGQWAHKDAPP